MPGAKRLRVVQRRVHWLALPAPLESYNGMQPCFLGGLLSRLLDSISSALINRGRVSRGSITSSIYPREAATYGLANLVRYSSTNSPLRCVESAACESSLRKIILTAPSG